VTIFPAPFQTEFVRRLPRHYTFDAKLVDNFVAGGSVSNVYPPTLQLTTGAGANNSIEHGETFPIDPFCPNASGLPGHPDAYPLIISAQVKFDASLAPAGGDGACGGLSFGSYERNGPWSAAAPNAPLFAVVGCLANGSWYLDSAPGGGGSMFRIPIPGADTCVIGGTYRLQLNWTPPDPSGSHATARIEASVNSVSKSITGFSFLPNFRLNPVGAGAALVLCNSSNAGDQCNLILSNFWVELIGFRS